MTARQRVHEILSVARPEDTVGRVFDGALVALISFNVVALFLETVDSIYVGREVVFRGFEVFSVAAFSIEYVLRVWSAPEDPRYSRMIVGRLRFMVTPLALVDLLAVLPFYLPALIKMDLRFLRAVRLVRILRLLKLGRYSQALQTICRVLAAKKEELLITVFIAFIFLVLGSAGVYHAEHDTQPEIFSSLPAALWWGVTTLSTVGYGDAVPITPVGKFLGSVVALLGIGMFALPTGILGAAFMDEMRRQRGGVPTCPHCGKEL